MYKYIFNEKLLQQSFITSNHGITTIYFHVLHIEVLITGETLVQ